MHITNYFEDINTPHVNTLPDRAYFMPFADEKQAATGLRERSSRMRLLNGSWKFKLFDNIMSVPEEMIRADYDACELGNIDVPGNWQTQGCDRYHYVGARCIIPFDPPFVPVDNPCGVYMTDFYYDASDELPVRELTFEGVDSCFYLWLNGSFVGYGEVSHALSSFDVSKFIVNGLNRLTVLNLKYCVGSYFEVQDKERISGIFRDVYLVARPRARLVDFFVKNEFNGDYSLATVDVEMEFEGEGEDAEIKLVSPEGEIVASRRVNIASAARVEFSVKNPKLWNAETPFLYTLYIKTKGEVAAQKVGLRRVSAENGVIKVNGKPIKLRGVNRHDTDPVTGYAVDRERILRDLTLMKRNNINAVRTAHYQNSPILLEMTNELGFYVMSEADHETHGASYSRGMKLPHIDGERDNSGTGYRLYCPTFNDDERYEALALDRMTKNPKREKNQPSVIIWSLGNESGWGRNQELAAAWIKKYDPSRLIHYESLFPGVDRKPDYSGVDVLSRMYPSTKWILEKYGEIESYDMSEDVLPPSDAWTERYYKLAMRDHPFVLCEFSHAMGNSVGDAEDYYSLMLSHERFAGGFVWEWADHAKYIGDERSGKPMYNYGGDSGEYPTDGAFCMDGLNYPDRRAHTGLLEYKNVIRPIRARWTTVNKTLRLTNHLDFLDARDAVEVRYEISRDAEIISAGILDIPAIAPGSFADIALPLDAPTDGICYLRLVYLNKLKADYMPVGFELGFDQLKFETRVSDFAPWFEKPQKKAELKLRETENVIVVTGESDKGAFDYTFDKKRGLFSDLKINNRQLLNAPMEYNISRAPTDNDRGYVLDYENWKDAGYYDSVTRVYSAKAAMEEGSAVIETEFSMAAIFRANILKAKATWTVTPDGVISFGAKVLRQTDFIYLPRFGVRMFVNKLADKVEYFGYGPTESYIDKHNACYRGLFKTDVDAMFEDYVRPQENGSHYDCAYVKLGSGKGPSIQAAAREGFSFSALRYTQESLTNAAHNYELKPCDSSVLCVDYKMSGIGSGSCGPQLPEKYRLCEGEINFRFKMLPAFV